MAFFEVVRRDKSSPHPNRRQNPNEA
jgi:hypothetical protein